MAKENKVHHSALDYSKSLDNEHNIWKSCKQVKHKNSFNRDFFSF